MLLPLIFAGRAHTGLMGPEMVEALAEINAKDAELMRPFWDDLDRHNAEMAQMLAEINPTA